jgi:hypothetical protein
MRIMLPQVQACRRNVISVQWDAQSNSRIYLNWEYQMSVYMLVNILPCTWICKINMI